MPVEMYKRKQVHPEGTRTSVGGGRELQLLGGVEGVGGAANAHTSIE